MGPVVLLSFAAAAAAPVDANARFLVTSATPKCVHVEIPSETNVKIHYEAHDFDESGTKDGAEVRSFLTLLERPIETVEQLRTERANDEASLEKRRARLNDLSERARTGIKPVSNGIVDSYGSFLYKTHGSDAVIELCVRDKSASPRSPKSFHLRVEELETEDPLDAFEREKSDLDNRVPRIGVEHHWTFLEAQLDRIEHEVKTIVREADFFKERDALYHQQTDDLHKATVFWPILHCCILLVTGFTQANHVINFFKQHRII